MKKVKTPGQVKIPAQVPSMLAKLINWMFLLNCKSYVKTEGSKLQAIQDFGVIKYTIRNTRFVQLEICGVEKQLYELCLALRFNRSYKNR
jgi:hypothetical protein